MRNRNEKFTQSTSHVTARNPFDYMDLHWQEVYLVCSACKALILPWAVAFKYDSGVESFYDDRQNRMDNLIHHNLKKHACTKALIENQIVQKRISEEEMMSGRIKIVQDRLDEIYAEPVPEPVPAPMFRVGQWVINTKSGHLWQLEEHDVETVTEGFKNGKRNVVPYE
jgi:hypothetical protein